MARFINTV